MPNTLEKQLRAEILKRQREKKQQEKVKSSKKKTFVLVAVLGIVSLAVSLGQWQIKKSVPTQLNRPTPEGEKQNPNAYRSETI